MLYSQAEILNWCVFDIETIPKENSFEKLSQKEKEVWLEKFHCKFLQKEIELRKQKLFLENLDENIQLYQSLDDVEYKKTITPDEIFIQYAPLHAEFGKAFCISIGVFDKDEETGEINREIITICEDNEKDTLIAFGDFLNSSTGKKLILSGFNIKGFDIPFLIKRYLINSLSIPFHLKLRGKKPWEVNIVDFCEDWKGLMWESTSLDGICTALGIKTPKDKFKNSEVVNLLLSGKITKEDVCEYCEKDVNANMDCILKVSDYKFQPVTS